MYWKGQHVRNKITSRIGEVLEAYGKGVFRVRYPIYNDEDRNFDIHMESYYDLAPTGWIQCDCPERSKRWITPS